MGMDSTQSAKEAGIILIFAYILCLIASPLLGYCMDYYGRRVTATVSCVLISLCFMVNPYAYHIITFVFVRGGIEILISGLQFNPLMSDYCPVNGIPYAATFKFLTSQIGALFGSFILVPMIAEMGMSTAF